MKSKILMIEFFFIKIYCLEIPFESKKTRNYKSNKSLSEFYDINLYTKIEIGSNNQQLEIPIKLNKFLTYITSSQNINLNCVKLMRTLPLHFKK